MTNREGRERIVKNRDISRWRDGARMGVMTAGACGLLLFAGGTSFAQSNGNAGPNDHAGANDFAGADDSGRALDAAQQRGVERQLSSLAPLLDLGGLLGGGGYGGGWGRGGIMNPVFICNKRAVKCIMGPLNSGNIKGGQNVWLKGNMSDAGSPGNVNGSINSDNTNHSGTNHDIHIQKLGR